MWFFIGILLALGILGILSEAHDRNADKSNDWIWVYTHYQQYGPWSLGSKTFDTKKEAYAYGNSYGPFHHPLDSRIHRLKSMKKTDYERKTKANP